jgi:GT2 family glycosyltransferase
MSRIGAVIVNWNAGQSVLRAIQSLLDEGIADRDIIIVDNASNDGSPERIANVHPHVRLHVLDSNLGFSKAANLARSELNNPYVLLLNPDAYMRPGSLLQLAQVLDEEEGVAAVGPRIVHPDGALQATCARRDYTLTYLLFEVTGLRRRFPTNRVFGGYRMEYWDHRGVRDVDAISGACMLIRQSAVPPGPLFDDTLPMYFEDIDFCRRIRDRSWRIRFVGNAEAVHIGGHSSGRSAHRTRLAVMEQGDAVWLFFRRHHGLLHAALASFLVGLGASIRLVYRTCQRAAGIIPDGPTLRAKNEKHVALLEWAMKPGKPHMTSL